MDCKPDVNVKTEPVAMDTSAASDLVKCSEIVDPPHCNPGQGTHTCPECLILYADQQQLDLHTKAVHSDTTHNPHKCSGCQGGFPSKEKQTMHMKMCKRIRPQTASHPCEICFISFEFKSLRDFHMSIHKDAEKKPYHCSGCHAGFAASTHKTSHEQKCGKLKSLNEESIPEPVKPENKESISAVGQKAEMKEEPMDQEKCKPTEPFGCKICTKRFSYFCDFTTHSRECKTQEQAVTQEANQAKVDEESGKKRELVDNRAPTPGAKSVSDTKSEGSSSSAKLDKTNTVCKICSIDVRTCTKLENYIKNASYYLSQHEKGHDGTERFYHCPGCNWGHLQREQYLNHVNSCGRVAEKIPVRALDRKAVNCPVCLVTFSHITKCEIHINNHHIVSKRHHSYNLLCRGCSAHFCIDTQLSAHENTCYINQNLLKMPQPKSNMTNCGFCRRARAHFEDHIRQYHTLASPQELICVNCEEKFNTVADLIVHCNTKCMLSHCLKNDIPELATIVEMASKPVEPPSVIIPLDAAPPVTTPSILTRSATTPSVVTEENNEAVVTVDETVVDSSDQASVMSDASNSTASLALGCEICGAKTKKARDRENHMLVHTEAKTRPFRCDGCAGGFLNRKALSNHERVCIPFRNRKIFGTPIKQPTSQPFTQPEMNGPALTSSLVVPDSYEVAIDSSGKVSLACHFCGKQHESELELVQHVNEEHPLDEPRCYRCGKQFLYAESLSEHKLFCGIQLSNEGTPAVVQTTKVVKDCNKPAENDSDNDEQVQFQFSPCYIYP